jgi:hypothetical protein
MPLETAPDDDEYDTEDSNAENHYRNDYPEEANSEDEEFLNEYSSEGGSTESGTDELEEGDDDYYDRRGSRYRPHAYVEGDDDGDDD